MAAIISAMCMAVGGFVVAFIIGWKFAFVCCGLIPMIFIGMIVLGIASMDKGKSKNYNKAGAYAE
jgi:ABC-type multidrug transport system fused ATPase/permease subunit